MDVYNFINSKDVRNYLKENNYEFNPVETAWIVWQSNRTLKEKHEAWKEIIDTIPDMPIQDRHNDIPSLHQFLKDYMQFERCVIDRFYNPTYECVFYQYSITGWYKGEYDRCDCKDIFYDFNSCYEEASSVIGEFENPIIEITMNSKDNKIKIAYEDLLLVQILDPGETTSEEEDMDYAFFEMWFPIPMPFKEGDIVIPTGNSHNGYCRFCDYKPYVFVSSSYEQYKEDGRILYDYSDMCAWGYSQHKDGQLDGDAIFNYMNFEYYTGELTKEKRVVKALSNCLKKKIDVVQFAMAYHQILMEQYSESTKPDWTNQYLELAGLKEE